MSGQAEPDAIENDADDPEAGEPDLRLVEVTPAEAGERIDRVLSGRVTDLSRARLQALMAQGLVSRDGALVRDHAAKAQAGLYRIEIPPVLAAEPVPENIPLVVLFEDEHLIVIDKPAGMAAHPGPGTPSGTLVNALLHHCGASLSGIGGVARPGIVHRLDKDTSGVMVAAKSDAAHQALSALFSDHSIERVYIALTRGAPEPGRATIATRIGRSTSDRKKMAVLKAGGREAVTHYVVERRFGGKDRPLAGRVACTLETGRTHQIRVHLASKGAPCLGDPVYGSGQPAAAVREAVARAGLTRQALHAAVLGFRHPLTGENLRFETPPPLDMARLESYLAEL